MLLAATLALKAQENLPPALNFHRWGSVTVFNGLPSDSVRAIAQTEDGILWFGTDNGLARFDGRRVQTFTFEAPEANHILSLKTSADGRLWVGTQNGAYIYSDGGFQPIGGTNGFGVTAILTSDELYFATDGGFVLSLQLDARVALKMMSAPLTGPDGEPLKITGLALKNGQLLLGTGGRGTLTLKDGRASEIVFTGRPMFVNALATDEKGDLSIGSDAKKDNSGIFHLVGDGRVVHVSAPTAKVLSLEADHYGIWAGTERYGLFHVRPNASVENITFENTSGGLRSNTIYSIFTDREGVVWIGTNRGVSRFDPAAAFQQTVSDVPNSNFIRVLYRTSDGAIYAGSNRGLFRADEGSWNEISALRNKVVYALQQNGSGDILIGTATGAFDLGGKGLAEGDTRAFANFNGRTYAAVYGRGIVDLSSPSQTVIFPNESVTSVLASTAKMWIGTAGQGLYSFDGTNVRSEASPDTLRSGTIYQMTETGGGLWIAGEHGVFVYGNGQIQQVIAAEDVRNVFVKDDECWAATTTRGLVHGRRDATLGWIVSSIGFEQGLPSEKAFSILPVGDQLLVATNRGVVTYATSTVPPKLIAVRVLSQRLHDLRELSSELSLDYPQNSLLVEVAGLSSRTYPEEFQYSFVLRNSRGEIVDHRFSSDPQYDPTSLKPGEYSIESIAFDRDLNASEPLVIKFSVARAPFPWTATALGMLLAIAVIGLVWAAFEHRRIRHRNRELAAARFDLANEAERERSRIARDLHDQTLADLRNLLLKSDKGALTASELRGEIESVSTEIRRICEDLSPSVLENVGLIPALEFLLSQTIENHTFTAEPGIDERIDLPLNVQLQIYRIAQEVLTNIKRHSDAGVVEMSVAMAEDGIFRLTIADDGTAFKPDGAGRGRGITNIRARAGLINANVRWAQNGDPGNIFSLVI